MARFWKLLVLICFLLIIDQLSKGWTQTRFTHVGESITVIEGFFSLTYVKNTGAAFGMGGEAHPIFRMMMFLAIPTLFSFWVLWMLIKSIKGPAHMSLAYALILAGAVGNLIDRFTLGYVVDMLHFYYDRWDFWVFNIADSCISVAAVLLIADIPLQWKKRHDQKTLESKP